MDITSRFFDLVQENEAKKPLPQRKSVSLQKKNRKIDPKYMQILQRAKTVQGKTAQCLKKLSHLNELSKRKDLFDENESQIDLLSASFQTDMQDISGEIARINQLLSNASMNASTINHSKAIVEDLASVTQDLTRAFQSQLKEHAEYLQQRAERRNLFMGTEDVAIPRRKGSHKIQFEDEFDEPTPVLSSSTSSSSSSSSVTSSASTSFNLPRHSNQKQIPTQRFNSSMAEDDDAKWNNNGLDENYAPLITERRHDERTASLNMVHRAMSEISTMFQDLGHLLTQQRESLQLIDANLDETTENMDASISALEKAKRKFASRRGLIIKCFLAIFVMLLIFGIFIK
ncbi:Syntaxin 5B [Monocercomonoides exilis]|uniref:Syntaxin 5B n=1 Tax=Monocercomonoides exilis TaxID=2049356 RepID=UPI003559698D|nr:Syntaxin 5B [Monocercomonoides exilis]